jgi:hypothetical protein
MCSLGKTQAIFVPLSISFNPVSSLGYRCFQRRADSGFEYRLAPGATQHQSRRLASFSSQCFSVGTYPGADSPYPEPSRTHRGIGPEESVGCGTQGGFPSLSRIAIVRRADIPHTLHPEGAITAPGLVSGAGKSSFAPASARFRQLNPRAAKHCPKGFFSVLSRSFNADGANSPPRATSAIRH